MPPCTIFLFFQRRGGRGVGQGGEGPAAAPLEKQKEMGAEAWFL
jgi:hypothetical protein